MPGKGVTAEDLATMTDLERDRLARAQDWAAERTGYFRLQGTRPQTLELRPRGLARRTAGVDRGEIQGVDELQQVPARRCGAARPPARECSGVLVHPNGGSSANLYYEIGARPVPAGPVAGAHGVAVFGRIWPSAVSASKWLNVTHWSDFDTGGHFAAMETPRLLVEDIRAFFATVT